MSKILFLSLDSYMITLSLGQTRDPLVRERLLHRIYVGILKVLSDSSYLILCEAMWSGFDAARDARPTLLVERRSGAHAKKRRKRTISRSITTLLRCIILSSTWVEFVFLPPDLADGFFFFAYVCVRIIYSKWNRKQNKSFVAHGMAKQWIYLYH